MKKCSWELSKDELLEIKEKCADERRTEDRGGYPVKWTTNPISFEEQQVAITLTHLGYLQEGGD